MMGGNEYVRLLSEAQSGNEDSIAEIAVIVQNPLYAFIYGRTADHDCAEDLLQETLLVMVQHLRSLRQFGSFWPWVHQIAYSKVQQYFRDRTRRLGLGMRLCQQYRQAHQTLDKDVLEAVVREENIKELLDTVRRMERRSRRVLYLRCFRGLSYGEIASLVRSTPNEVRARLCRARKVLKERMITLRT